MTDRVDACRRASALSSTYLTHPQPSDSCSHEDRAAVHRFIAGCSRSDPPATSSSGDDAACGDGSGGIIQLIDSFLGLVIRLGYRPLISSSSSVHDDRVTGELPISTTTAPVPASSMIQRRLRTKRYLQLMHLWIQHAPGTANAAASVPRQPDHQLSGMSTIPSDEWRVMVHLFLAELYLDCMLSLRSAGGSVGDAAVYDAGSQSGMDPHEDSAQALLEEARQRLNASSTPATASLGQGRHAWRNKLRLQPARPSPGGASMVNAGAGDLGSMFTAPLQQAGYLLDCLTRHAQALSTACSVMSLQPISVDCSGGVDVACSKQQQMTRYQLQARVGWLHARWAILHGRPLDSARFFYDCEVALLQLGSSRPSSADHPIHSPAGALSGGGMPAVQLDALGPAVIHLPHLQHDSHLDLHTLRARQRLVRYSQVFAHAKQCFKRLQWTEVRCWLPLCAAMQGVWSVWHKNHGYGYMVC